MVAELNREACEFFCTSNSSKPVLAQGAKVTHAVLRIWLQVSERFHLHVQKSLGYNSDLIFQLSVDLL
jgi:hypothetical protein